MDETRNLKRAKNSGVDHVLPEMPVCPTHTHSLQYCSHPSMLFLLKFSFLDVVAAIINHSVPKLILVTVTSFAETLRRQLRVTRNITVYIKNRM